MKFERTQNATKNIIAGVSLKLYQIIVPFLMRTVMIYTLGIQYLGLNTLFSSVLQVLNLAELGVGSAMVYSMYRPIVENDRKKICALLQLYRLYYRIIGCAILVIGLAILPFIPNLVKGDVPDGINLYVLYLLNLLATVCTYLLYAYKSSLFMAHQRNDVISKVTFAVNTVQYLVQAALLLLFKNYYAYLIVSLVCGIAVNLVVALCASKTYPFYRPEGRLPSDEIRAINRKVRDLFTSKVGSVIVDSADTIVISAFLGLTVLAVYQNYFYILSSIAGFIAIIFTSCSAGIGNSLIVETEAKNFHDLKKFTFIIMWISGFCTAAMLCLYQPFMEIWVGSEYCLDYSIVICLGVYFYVLEINRLLNIYKDAAGLWHEDRWRPLVTALSNLAMNLLTVQFWGLYGVILSTVLSTLFIGMPWLLHNIFTTLFDRKRLSGYLRTLTGYTVVTAAICIVTCLVCSIPHWSAWPTFFFRAGVCVVLPNLLYLVIFARSPEFADSLLLADKITKGRIPPLAEFARKASGDGQ